MEYYNRLDSERESTSQYTRAMGIYLLLLIVGALNIGAFGSLLKLLAVVPIAVWIIEKHMICLNTLIKCTFPFVLWCMLSVIWSINFSESLNRAETQIMFLVLLFSVAGYSFNKAEIKYLFKCLVWSSRITAFFVLISADYLSGRIYLNSFVQEDPNYLCAYFMFAVVYDVFVLLSVSHSWREKAKVCCELTVYLYIILATGSRGGLLALIVTISVVMLLYRDKTQSIGNSLYKRGFFIFVLFLVYGIAQYNISSDIILRFSYEAISESNGTGRYELWEDAINAFNNSSVFRQFVGYGTATARDITYLFPFHRHNVLHNIYVENLLEIGIIGTLFYIMHIYSFLAYTIKKREIYSLAILAGMITLSLSTSLYAFKPFWNILIFTLCLSRYKDKRHLDLFLG